MSKDQRDNRPSTKVDEQIQKLIASFGNSMPAEQKVKLLAKNFIELEKESNKNAAVIKQNAKFLEKEQREKDNLQREYNKCVLIRDKLEDVCREQQKLMKSIKSESMSKIRDEEEKRKETQAHFQKSINEIFSTLGKNNDENIKIKEANIEMTKKFKYLAEQYELREKQLEKLNEQIKLETQLNEAKLTKLKLESTVEKEILLKEKQAALEDLCVMKKTMIEVETREKALKEQLSVYTEKYEQFQTSLQRSNDVFSTYKTELEKMSKKIKSLEKELNEWRTKYEKANSALLNMVADKQAQDEYVNKTSRQMQQMQKLCRTMQAERTALIQLVEANNLERPVLSEIAPDEIDDKPMEKPKPMDKLDIMSRNCKELKDTLAQLQDQMNAITVGEKKGAAETNKKAKGKKNKAKNDTAPQLNNETAKLQPSSNDEDTKVQPCSNDESPKEQPTPSDESPTEQSTSNDESPKELECKDAVPTCSNDEVK